MRKSPLGKNKPTGVREMRMFLAEYNIGRRQKHRFRRRMAFAFQHRTITSLKYFLNEICLLISASKSDQFNSSFLMHLLSKIQCMYSSGPLSMRQLSIWGKGRHLISRGQAPASGINKFLGKFGQAGFSKGYQYFHLRGGSIARFERLDVPLKGL